MKLRIFQSDKGDCLLLQSRDGKNVLCDGGMARAYRAHARHLLPDLIGDGGRLDYVYVSHIDQDHISGVLQLLNDALDWKVFDHHQQNGVSSVREPDFPRPAAIGGLWHNSFRDQVGDNAGPIGDLLAASVPVLYGSAVPDLVDMAHDAENIANSIPEALKVSRICKPDLLDVVVNEFPGSAGPAKLLYFRDQPQSFHVGDLKFTIIGPTERELDDLRQGWNNWLNDPEKNSVAKVRAEMKKRVEAFAAGQFVGSPFDLRNWNGVKDFEGVTVPNVASLMFMVEEDDKKLLLTGDGQQDKILDGLDAAGFLDNGHLHVDVLKIQHHGSEHNMDRDFARKVSADHYVFCGDGSHGNPEPEVLDIVFKSRIGPASRRALAPEAEDRRFKFWFSTRADKLPTQSAKRRNFEEVEAKIGNWESEHGDRFSAEWVARDYRTLTI
ncbi:MBL fold metallo-hydrolase [Marimonas arenosa]|uniref:MBL fold metallo-hydrolase n=1 Tax=Marimonas arenosa TaxID=1795305 RepID=A0AAE4B585_9RHOB|nr:MBL fold metallo-hydrolase [Marimonas arenosa]MDQ2091803.1 MBL fold metallo-hydrolase [Marimonas arenosa]